jgi:hypothetical protein
MKQLVLVFLLLAIVPAALYFAGPAARRLLWNKVSPVAKFIAIAAVVTYLLLMVFYALGSPKLL